MSHSASAFALSRRSFLASAGAFSVAVAFGSSPGRSSPETSFKPNAWVTIEDNGEVTIVGPMVEMGQGVSTALPLILAEELDADWNRVRVSDPPQDERTFGHPTFKKLFGVDTLSTGGSFSVTGYYDKLRLVGAQARKVLLANAAEIWKAPVEELTTSPGTVVHAKSGRKLSYGDIARVARVPDPLPEVGEADLKPRSQFRLIGTDVGRVDVPGKVDGSARYGIDVQAPGMLYAAVLFPDVQYERAEQIDDAAAKAVSGVVKIVNLPSGVGVIADSFEAAVQARSLLGVTWSNSAPARAYDDSQVLQDYRRIAADGSRAGVDMIRTGDADAQIKTARWILAGEYLSDHVAHACMEPLNVTVRVDNGEIDVWSGSQSPTTMKFICAAVGKTSPDKVRIHPQLLGGAFGRKGDGDDMVVALMLALNAPGRPVKTIWSREDDFRNSKPRPLTAQRVEVGLDGERNIVAWRHRIVNESYLARTLPPEVWNQVKADIVTGGHGEVIYGPPSHHRVEWVRSARGVDVGSWRGVAAGYTKFAIETMIDEVAAFKRMDPLQYRLSMLGHAPRAANVLRRVAEMSRFASARDGDLGVGIAYSDDLESHTAVVAQVSVDAVSGKITVHRLWCAIDAGLAVQPKNIVAQVTGGMTFGLGAALTEQLAIRNGVMQATNFDGYHVLRMSDMPLMDVEVLSTDNPPSGVGEAGVPAVAPAIANAVAQLTGKRLRHIPMTPDRVKRALG